MKPKEYEWYKNKYGDRKGNWPVRLEGQIVLLPLAVEMFLVQKYWHLRDSKGIKKIYYKRLKRYLQQPSSSESE
jgi:hypothetical protein